MLLEDYSLQLGEYVRSNTKCQEHEVRVCEIYRKHLNLGGVGATLEPLLKYHEKLNKMAVKK